MANCPHIHKKRSTNRGPANKISGGRANLKNLPRPGLQQKLVQDIDRDHRADHFILSGYPHLAEAYRFAELVFPKLPIRHQLARFGTDVNNGPFGKTVANLYRPGEAQASS